MECKCVEFINNNITDAVLSGVICGGLTLVGVLVTVKYYKRQDKEKYEHEKKIEAAGFVFLLLSRIRVLDQIDYHGVGKIYIPEAPIFTTEHSLFLYNRLHSVYMYLSEEDVYELIDFMSRMERLEELRRYCNEKIKERSFSGIMEDEFIRQYTMCMEKRLPDKEDGMLKGIDEIVYILLEEVHSLEGFDWSKIYEK